MAKVELTVNGQILIGRADAQDALSRVVFHTDGVDPSGVTTWANGARVPHTVADGFVRFELSATALKPSDWAVTW